MPRPDVMLPIAMARLLQNGDVVYHGLAAALPLIAIQLARRLHAPALHSLSIAGGIDAMPEQLAPSTADPRLLAGTRALFALSDAVDLAARGRLDVAILPAAQIDAAGRIRFGLQPAGAESAALLHSARRSICWMPHHDRRSCVASLNGTIIPASTTHVITPLCVFRQQDGHLLVESLLPDVSAAQLREQTGFAVEVGPDTPQLPPPSIDELNALAAIDPEGLRKSAFQ